MNFLKRGRRAMNKARRSAPRPPKRPKLPKPPTTMQQGNQAMQDLMSSSADKVDAVRSAVSDATPTGTIPAPASPMQWMQGSVLATVEEVLDDVKHMVPDVDLSSGVDMMQVARDAAQSAAEEQLDESVKAIASAQAGAAQAGGVVADVSEAALDAQATIMKETIERQVSLAMDTSAALTSQGVPGAGVADAMTDAAPKVVKAVAMTSMAPARLIVHLAEAASKPSSKENDLELAETLLTYGVDTLGAQLDMMLALKGVFDAGTEEGLKATQVQQQLIAAQIKAASAFVADAKNLVNAVHEQADDAAGAIAQAGKSAYDHVSDGLHDAGSQVAQGVGHAVDHVQQAHNDVIEGVVDAGVKGKDTAKVGIKSAAHRLGSAATDASKSQKQASTAMRETAVQTSTKAIEVANDTASGGIDGAERQQLAVIDALVTSVDRL